MEIEVYSGYTREGEFFVVGVKVVNDSKFPIRGVHVYIEVPKGFEFTETEQRSYRIGIIPPDESRTTKYRLRPKAAVAGKVTGSVEYRVHKPVRDFRRQVLDIKPFEIYAITTSISLPAEGRRKHFEE